MKEIGARIEGIGHHWIWIYHIINIDYNFMKVTLGN